MENRSEVTKKILRKVREVEIRTNRMVTEAMAGAYHSIFKGQGMDFEEVREYEPGDDIRTIDWNVSAKMDRPYIKKYREERELTIMLLVDLSGSKGFGSVEASKREISAEMASVIAFSATKNNDKLGLILFTDKIEKFITPKKGRHHVLRLIREILFFKPQNKKTDIPATLDFLNKVHPKKAVVFLFSDFLQGNSDQEAILKSLDRTNQRHDLICVAVNDRRELELPRVGIITLEDAETGEFVEINTLNIFARKKYAQANRERTEAFRKNLKQRSIDALYISTDKPYITALREFLKNRISRRR